MVQGRQRRYLIFSFLICLFASAAFGGVNERDTAIYRDLFSRVSRARIQSTYEKIASFGSRLAGSAGERRTLDYCDETLRALGAANVHKEEFNVSTPDPLSTGALTITTGSGGTSTVSVDPLWPNLVRTSTCDVRGPLIYGGDGTLESLRGKSIEGSIVILEFNTGANWLIAAKLGAAAVVFIEPSSSTRSDSERKFTEAPLDVPRFYLPLDRAGSILTAAMHGSMARLKCRQDWRPGKSGNLVAEFPGSDPGAASEPVVLFAYVDSMSVAPGIAPGSEGIGGMAAALEIARVYRDAPHRRPLRVVFSGAHALGLQGAREYVEHQIETDAPGPLLVLTLDLSSGSDSLGCFARGYGYQYRDESQTVISPVASAFRDHANQLAPLLKASAPQFVVSDDVNNGDGKTWQNEIPGKFAFDCEPFVNSGMNALTLATDDDDRPLVDTPFDTLDHVDVESVVRQIKVVTCLFHHALNDTTSSNETSEDRIAVSPAKPVRMSLIGGFSTLEGQVVRYDPIRSFLPDTPVPDSLAVCVGRDKTFMGVRGSLVQLTQGPKADYRFLGVAPQNSSPELEKVRSLISAYHLDPANGRIDEAPSLGYIGDGTYPIEFPLTVSDRSSPIVVFPCVPINLFGMIDPQDLTVFGFVGIFDADGGSTPQDFGLSEIPGGNVPLPNQEDSRVMFLIPGQHFVLLAGSRGDVARLILTHSSPTDEQGVGYIAPKYHKSGSNPQKRVGSGARGSGTGGSASRGVVSGGSLDNSRSGEDVNSYLARTGSMPDLYLTAAEDIAAINEGRLRQFRRYRMISPGVEQLQQFAKGEIQAAERAQAARDWPGLDRHARAAWGFALRAHPILQGTASDVLQGVVFYLFLIIPFSYFMERLLIGSQLLSHQLGWSVSFFIGAFLLLRLIHPAFEIVSNPLMIFVAFVMGTLSVIVIAFILGKFESSMRTVRSLQAGLQEVDVKRSSVAMAAFNLGVSNMRRRKARTILTTLTLVVMTFIVLSFTSIVQDLTIAEDPSTHVAAYAGMVVRNPGLDPLPAVAYSELANEFGAGAHVVRRAYYYGANQSNLGTLSIRRADQVTPARAIEGLDADETEVLKPQRALIAGRWFRPGERDAVIISKPMADLLKIHLDEVGKADVRFGGTDFTVVGITDPGQLRGITDLDGDGLMPADFSLSTDLQQQTRTTSGAFRPFVRLDPESVVLMPAETAIALGADVRNIGVSFDDPRQTRKALDDLMPRFRLNLYASVPGPTPNSLVVKQFSVLQGSKSAGILFVLIQLAIASVFVLNTMIATVYERTKEIGIFSAIGLAPNHIAMLFFAESLVYGVLGAVIGYFLAQASAKVIVATGSLPGLTLNFSSTSAALSAGIVMAVVLLSTIYPARKAVQIAAPAMNEKVFETDPIGDTWNLPLPFSISASEAGPISLFLADWLRAYEGYTIGEFVTKDTSLMTFRRTEGEPLSWRLEATTWLAPYDLGISQRLDLTMSPTPVEGVYSLDLVLTLIGGDAENWPVVNRRFLANVRRRFLTWRTLDSETRDKYFSLASEFAEASQEVSLV